jgi:4-diphosphocytidyl-2-C-methyl-D-erythritol kinase
MALSALLDLPAPAKLNLFLHVVGRRADGYHLLQSAFVLIDWADRLHVERRRDGRLQRHDLGLALPAEDLCLRAARALQQASGSPWGADLHLDKQLPWGAGLGGGSSDAATTLIALNRLWGLGWSRHRLLALAATLGADVPFFVGGHNAFVEGIGERLTPLHWPRTWYAVVKPSESLPTPLIFGDPDLERSTDPVIVAGFLADAERRTSRLQAGCSDGAKGAADDAADEGSDRLALGAFPGGPGGQAPGAVARARVPAAVSRDELEYFGRNDLQPVAERHCPAVAGVARWLSTRFGASRMTGSGSAVFASAGTGALPRATFSPESLPAGWVGRMCRSLEAHPLAGWLS